MVEGVVVELGTFPSAIRFPVVVSPSSVTVVIGIVGVPELTLGPIVVEELVLPVVVVEQLVVPVVTSETVGYSSFSLSVPPEILVFLVSAVVGIDA